MNRRDFIAGIMAWIAVKKLPAVAASTQAQSAPPLVFATLYDAYNECCYGRIEPDRMIVSGDLYAALQARVCELRRNDDAPIQYGLLKFNAATIVMSPYMPNDRVWMQNSGDPFNPRLNKIINLEAVV